MTWAIKIENNSMHPRELKHIMIKLDCIHNVENSSKRMEIDNLQLRCMMMWKQFYILFTNLKLQNVDVANP